MLDRGRYKGIYPVKGVLLLDNSCFALFQPPDCDWLAAGAPWKPSWRAGAGYLGAPVPSCPRLLAPGSDTPTHVSLSWSQRQLPGGKPQGDRVRVWSWDQVHVVSEPALSPTNINVGTILNGVHCHCI